MRVLLTAIGSFGDVHPVVGLGRRLQARGHEVLVLACPYFQELIERAGLKLRALGTTEQYLDLVHDPDLWRSARAIRTIARGIVTVGVRETYDLIAAHHLPGETVVVAASLDLGARVAREKLGVPTVGLHLAPGVFRSVHLSPVLPPSLSGPRVPKLFKRLQYWLADTLLVDPLLGPALNGFRAELGLTPVRRIFGDWWHRLDRVLGMFPAWFAPPQPDWPTNLHLTGFPLWDESELSSVSAEVAEYFTRGEPPVLFTPGSAMAQGQEFFAAAIEACARLGTRGLLLTRYREHLPSVLPAHMQHFDFVPFSYALPRSAAVVHHGGIGSLSQGLAAGVPQLVMPMAHDQPDNATRLIRLGVGEALPPKRFRGPAVARAIERLVTSPRVAQACRAIAERMQHENGLKAAADVIERLGADYGQLVPRRTAPLGSTPPGAT